jgi:hypothetical protein
MVFGANKRYESVARDRDTRAHAILNPHEEARMERITSMIRSDLAFAAGLRNPSLVAAR